MFTFGRTIALFYLVIVDVAPISGRVLACLGIHIDSAVNANTVMMDTQANLVRKIQWSKAKATWCTLCSFTFIYVYVL